MDAQKLDGVEILRTASDPLVGSTIADRFRLIANVGAGGLSDVFKACEVASVRTCALKLIHINRECIKSGFELFSSNAKPTVQHPNLLNLHACGVTPEGEPWVAYEWLEAETLQALISREGALPFDTIVEIFQQIADAIGYAHSKGEVHFNLKPSNILLVERDGKPFVKISDFGFSKLLMERELEMVDEKAPPRGSPLYMSPEQFKGTRIDSRSDIYAFGCMLYECLTGRPPHQGVDLLETMDRHLHTEVTFPDEPEISEPMQAVLKKLLAKDPLHRHRSLSDAMADVCRAMQGEFPKIELLPAATDDSRGVDFITAKRGTSGRKGREPWLLLMSCVTVLLFVLVFQQCMSMVRESRKESIRAKLQQLHKPQRPTSGRR